MNREKLIKGPKHFVEKNKILYCWNCEKKTEWNYFLGKVRYNGVRPCLECSICGESIPAFAIDSYNERGIPCIPV